MSTQTKKQYFEILIKRYQESTSKNERTKIIEEAIENTKMHRKSVIRRLNRKESTEIGRSTGRPKKYDSKTTQDLLKKLYRASGYQCSGKLKCMIPVLLSQSNEYFNEAAKNEVTEIASASMDRYLKSYRNLNRIKNQSGTRPGSKIFKKLIPIKSLGNIAQSSGQLNADTVAHCGGSLAGDFIWSLTITDEHTGWTENRGVFGKYGKNVLEAMKLILDHLPFEILSFNVDNGTEFLNGPTYEYFKSKAAEKSIPFPMTRSRPYHKNDNAHVEQKNWTHVRQLFGYDRYEYKDLLPIMNEVYRLQGLLNNFFIPQYKLKSKVRIGSKIKKKYHTPKTPYERVLLDPKVSDDQKKKLKETYLRINYFDLVKKREEFLSYFLKLNIHLKSLKVAA